MNNIDLARLFKLRLVVARYGEMDMARWWNTKGMLGRYGEIVLKRGFPRTHFFAQARVVFAVARHRCEEVFNPPGCMTLWSLPAWLEDQFEEQWYRWLDDGSSWDPFFAQVEGLPIGDLGASLSELELLTADQQEQARRLHRSSEGRAVPISGVHNPEDDVITMLTAGFACGTPGALAVPYARLE